MPVEPGWYRDPVDEFEARWWSGREWTQDVRTGRFTTTSPVIATPIPVVESVLWSVGGNALTTHAAHVVERGKQIVLPWWSVVSVSSTISAGQSMAGMGTLVLHIAYPGYTDRAEWRMRSVSEPDRLHALAYGLMRRHRVAAGYG